MTEPEDFAVRPGLPPARPRAATTVAVLLVVLGLLGLLLSWLLLMTLNDGQDTGETVSGVFYVVLFIQLGLSGLQTVSGIGVWRASNRSWILAIVICSINLVGILISLLFALGSGSGIAPVFAGVVVNFFLISRLLNEDVRSWCQSWPRGSHVA